MIAFLSLLAFFAPVPPHSLCPGVIVQPISMPYGDTGYGVVVGCATRIRATCDDPAFGIGVPRRGFLFTGDVVTIGAPIPQALGTHAHCTLETAQGAVDVLVEVE